MSELDAEVRALFKQYEGGNGEDKLHALLSACGLRFEGVEPPPFEPVGYVRPTTRPLTEAERAMMAEFDAQLLSERPCAVHAPTTEERWTELANRERERTEHWSPATRASMRRHGLRETVRYGCRRLRAGNEYRWARPLAAVRAETVAALRELGHPTLGSIVLGDQVDANALRRVRRANVRALSRRRRRGVGRPYDVAQLTRWLADLGHSALPSADPWYEPDGGQLEPMR